MNDKIIQIKAGASLFPISAGLDSYNGILDTLDSRNQSIFHTDHVNTDPSKLLFGKNQQLLHGVLSPGKYGAIWCQNDLLGWHWLLFDYKYWDQVNAHDDVTLEMATLPSSVKNPSMDNKYILSWVCIHRGGLTSDYSEGCLTIYPKEYFPDDLFLLNEKAMVILS